ncbi:hypothetical protein EYZ11_001399 [Aspergillus tanneri]|uniref:Uncharacterized protein n=1 Tax=Aspergillus tanneri TaxID=1220188 RepID=A0A4S3JUR9_9EURO|nr:hypothetical protein EYZ11_001399 [Aspergillus tanneri]
MQYHLSIWRGSPKVGVLVDTTDRDPRRLPDLLLREYIAEAFDTSGAT